MGYRFVLFQETLSTYPASFSTPILYLVHKLSCRGRIDDLVNDIYFFVKDHYLIGEQLTYTGGRKKRVKILKVTYSDVENDAEASASQCTDAAKKPAIFLKRGELLIPSAERYTYDISLLDKNNVETGEIRERVSHQQLL
ncbi:unnamed protein product [Gongylonema pulchrum]|uniref:WAC domain-containing protein n=1 Tax=Gongylonema pulchrum TaxID=637853 RepID=A0A183ESU4_9BILA|nr:unnamed protein product [Gongylonema pulchrum]